MLEEENKSNMQDTVPRAPGLGPLATKTLHKYLLHAYLCKRKRLNGKTNVVLENTYSADTLPEDGGLWKQTAFSENQWARVRAISCEKLSQHKVVCAA